jgi:acyl-CoA thioesterase-1
MSANKSLLPLALCCAVSASLLTACQSGGGRPLDQANVKILTVGGSLTAGQTLYNGPPYPEQLVELTGLKIINMGVAGQTSRNTLRCLGDSLAAFAPEVVLITVGGNDSALSGGLEGLRQNLAQMIELVQASGAYPWLIAVPRDAITTALGGGGERPPQQGYSDPALYAELGAEYDVPVVLELVAQVLNDPRLRSLDGVHPNEEGYAVMAQGVADRLMPFLLKRNLVPSAWAMQVADSGSYTRAPGQGSLLAAAGCATAEDSEPD